MIQISDERWNEVKEKMCDDYCYFAMVSRSQAVLDKHCEECPMNTVEYPLGRNDWQE